MALTIDNLQIEIDSNAQSACNGIDALAKSLNALKTAVSGSSTISSELVKIASGLDKISGIGNIRLGSAANQIKKIYDSVNGISGDGFSMTLGGIADGLRSLSSVTTVNLTSTAKGLKEIGAASESLKSVDLTSFKEQVSSVAGALEPLKNIGSFTVGRAISQLGKIPDINKSLDKATVDQFASSIERLTNIMGPLAREMQAVYNGFSSLPKSMRSCTSSANSAKRSFNSLSTSVARTASKFMILFYAARRIAGVFSDALNESNAYIENMNLFRVSMGDATDEALRYASTVQDAMGIDISEWIKNQGVFMRLANGFGVASDKAALMSKNLTQLGYDMASFFNTSVETAMQKLQSGMSGQIKGLKVFGINLSVAALQETALSIGIEQSVRKMTEAQRAQLRYITLIQRSKGIMGDMGRTLITPANSMRILSAQITQLKRAFGNIVSVLAVKVIPYLMAFVSIMKDAANAIAEFFHFSLPNIDYSGLGPAEDYVDGIGEGIDDTAESAKKLKAQLMGFDELNVLNGNNDSGTSSLGASDLGVKLEGYNFLTGMVDQIDEIKERMKKLLTLAGVVGSALLAWKISNALPVGLRKIDDIMSNITKTGPVTLLNKDSIAALPQMISGVALAGGLIYTAWQNSENFRNGCAMLYEAGKKAFDGIAEAVDGLVKKLKLPELDGETLTTFASGAVMAIGMIATALGAPILGGISAFAGAAVLSIQSIGDAAEEEYREFDDIGANLVASIGSGLSFALAALVVGTGPVGAAIAGVTAAAVAFGVAMSTDAVKGVEIFDETISESTKNKVEPFIQKMKELDTTLKTLDFSNAVIDDVTASKVEMALSDIKATISVELDTKSSNIADTFGGLKDFMGESEYASMLEQSKAFYDGQKELLNTYESEINSIMSSAAEEKRSITDDEWAQINQIQSDMMNLGVASLSETEIEYETIMRNLKDNSARMSLEQASEIIKNAQKTRDDTIKSAETQYSRVLLEAKQMFEAGAINKETYDNITKAAKDARDSTVSDAENQYSDILSAAQGNLGELSRYIDTETGGIKSKWNVFCEDVQKKFSQKWGEMKAGWEEWKNGFLLSWDEMKTTFKTGWDCFWDGIGETIDGAINGIISAVESGLNKCIDALNTLNWDVPDWVPWVGGKSFGLNIKRVRLGRVDFFENGGFPVTGDMFIAREAGPELVGRIGNKTSVANNDQIIAGIASGVEDANKEVISAAFAVGAQIIAAIRESGDTYMDGEKVTGAVSAIQMRQNRMYGTT